MPRSRTRSRSESPRRIQRTRSRSRSPRPRTHDDQPRRRDKGFKWKEQRDNVNDPKDSPQARGLERGYKNHCRMEQNRTHSPLRRDPAAAEESELKSHVTPGPGRSERRDKKEKRKNKAAGPAMPQEPMIIVNVNDRLGTKAAIPCLASDQIKLFKAQVAARIGREPHEILLKRQGERPFRDELTLADYGVSSGVQLDLEVDTGD